MESGTGMNIFLQWVDFINFLFLRPNLFVDNLAFEMMMSRLQRVLSLGKIGALQPWDCINVMEMRLGYKIVLTLLSPIVAQVNLLESFVKVEVRSRRWICQGKLNLSLLGKKTFPVKEIHLNQFYGGFATLQSFYTNQVAKIRFFFFFIYFYYFFIFFIFFFH